uniref:RNA polymerase subunit H/Rpb5 C-terminal domain-containing protein n=1 Tax=Strombidium inclinatum TaxID=197538 RepID=A0A7S3N0M2_9SPIT
MLSDRGYNIGQEHYAESVDSLKEKITKTTNPESGAGSYNGLDYQYFKKQDGRAVDADFQADFDHNKIGVFWRYEEDKINSETLKGVQIAALTLKVNRVILIVKGETSLAKRTQADSKVLAMEVFTLDDLQVNITEHVLVPKHTVLTDDQKQELLKQYRIKDHQLPKIRSSDPIARYFGVSRGDVMKIIRPSETAGRYVTYRVVM